MNAASPRTSVLAAATAIALAPAAALIFLSPSAAAQTRGQTASASIEIVVTSANSAAGLIVRQQIEAAARKACAAVATHSPLLPREQADCAREATAVAMGKLQRSGEIALASK